MSRSSCRDRLEQALHRIADPAGEGVRACLTVYAEGARAAADAADARAAGGANLGPLDGSIVSIKDLFDVAGEPTRAGSKILAEEAKPATADAIVVQRLRAAGAVIVAKTNMTEFAFSGIGANPHFGTPGNPRDRKRVPGGSSSGAPVAVADGICEIAIGTDTGGSVRVPAGLCGLVGFKPSLQRVPTDGAFPLSKTLDSIGPIAKTVTDCAKADAVMADEKFVPLEQIEIAGLRLAVAVGLPLERLDDTVAGAFSAAMSRLSSAGMNVLPGEFAQFDDMTAINNRGGISPPEACVVHRDRMKRRAADIDPNVRARIERGCAVTAEDYADMFRKRTQLVAAMDEKLKAFDVIAMPTTSIVAPTIAEVADQSVFAARNMAVLRNTSIINFFDLCAVSLPLPDTALPVGLMLAARNGQDRMLLRIADAVMQHFGG
jgi:aspartyl-tRNA(Asn)/glutamyl-tRNA(Gln) amidotransferase subunit A